MDEVFEITEYVQEEAGYGTDLIWGNCYDETLGDQLSVTVIATGFDSSVGLLTLTRIAGASADAQFIARAEQNVKVEGGESRRCARLRPFPWLFSQP